MQFQISSTRLEFSEKFTATNFALSDAEDNTSGLLNRGGIADLTLLRTPKVPGSDGLFFLYYNMQVWQLQELLCNDY